MTAARFVVAAIAFGLFFGCGNAKESPPPSPPPVPVPVPVPSTPTATATPTSTSTPTPTPTSTPTSTPTATSTPTPTPTAIGPTTTLTLKTSGRSMRMDAPDPVTRVALRSTSGATLRDIEWSGEWSALGFSKAANAYVLALTSTVGAWRGIVAIRYLDEAGAFRESKGAGSHFFGLASVASPELGAIAFVSQRRETPLANAFKLELLDLATDTMRELGTAPAPPPLGRDSSFCKNNAPRKWGDDNTGAWEPLDDGIVVFDGGNVRASYGADTCGARATKRTAREWPVAVVPPPTKL